MQLTSVALPSQSYLYVERECAYGPEIAEAMASAFGEMFTFVQEHGITPASMPISVYVEMDPDVLRFRGGYLVTPEDAAKATGPVRADELPPGDVVTVTHVGPYEGLAATHREMEETMKADGTPSGLPIWEHYVDDPGAVAEDELRTEIFRPIASRR